MSESLFGASILVIILCVLCAILTILALTGTFGQSINEDDSKDEMRGDPPSYGG